ncbi:MAG: stage 0 sporulation family protein [Thermodesulfobacteriota bacterium]
MQEAPHDRFEDQVHEAPHHGEVCPACRVLISDVAEPDDPGDEFTESPCIAPPFRTRPTPAVYPQGKKPVTVKVSIVGVRFGCAGKIYHFDAGGLDLKLHDWVIVRTEKGMGLGQAIVAPFEAEVEPHQLDEIRRVIRKAERADFEQRARCRKREAEAYNFCLNRIEVLSLPMKLVAVECYFDYTKYVFYFTAEGRIDFRELVKQLVSRFPVRIEMRQIGVRHEAKMLGGIACCGQELCCSRFLTEFRPVSVKMAKRQNLSLNPTKISGVCGRLMCCLAYEHETYEEFRKEVPKEGKPVNTVYGPGVIVKHNPLEESITVRLNDDTVVEIRKEEIVSPDEPPSKDKELAKKETAHPTTGHRPPRRRGGNKYPPADG